MAAVAPLSVWLELAFLVIYRGIDGGIGGSTGVWAYSYLNGMSGCYFAEKMDRWRVWDIFVDRTRWVNEKSFHFYREI